MQTTEKRIAALESSASDKSLKVVLVLDGETPADALKRLRLPPHVVAVYLSELDERI
ncbi:MAG: hypothetical protein H3C29_07095 [Simplicispira suum]|jgi:hypothetical protein|uniref:hypothetical protein n=1 Tax=Simplicispira suum TaxID=2109915 RepID=UPI001C6C743F|nr:hypothetical protein [Simplicispira suum]MBW7832965.1 hypothetical protein [Simplicispira suum]